MTGPPCSNLLGGEEEKRRGEERKGWQRECVRERKEYSHHAMKSCFTIILSLIQGKFYAFSIINLFHFFKIASINIWMWAASAHLSVILTLLQDSQTSNWKLDLSSCTLPCKMQAYKMQRTQEAANLTISHCSSWKIFWCSLHRAW